MPRGVASLKYSVIIPAFNCAGSIAKTVESVQKAGLPDCEIIIVDDGSTDGTTGSLDALCKRYGNIFAFSQANGGASSARNLGLQKARGDYVLFVDADEQKEKYAVPSAFAAYKFEDYSFIN